MRKVSATDKAQRRWTEAARASQAMTPCSFCLHRFKTPRGAKQHERTCWHNPGAECYTSGDYDATLDEKGRVVGFVWNGDDEHHRRRIRNGMVGALGAMGMPSPRFAKSHRERVLGPDLHEPCAVCPDSRRRHDENVGACNAEGCRCQEFTGVSA